VRRQEGASTERGVLERPFRVECGGEEVPGLVWTPEASVGERPLVLIGHGGASSMRSDYVVRLARRLVRHLGYAAVALEGPNHGERHVPGRDRGWWQPEVVDQVIAEWEAAVAALQGDAGIGAGPLGYWGLSMGARFGIPLIARGPQIAAAVVGLSGPRDSEDPIVKHAAAVSCPVLFLLQWHDELVARERALALFDAIGSEDKRLHAQPGPHRGVPPEEFDASEAFLGARLGPSR